VSLRYNLQFFAKEGPGGEKTEQPTTKRLTDARKDGKVAKSKELSNGIGLLVFFFSMKLLVGTIGVKIIEVFSLTYTRFAEFAKPVRGEVATSEYSGFLRVVMSDLLFILLPIFLVAFVFMFVVDLVQVKWKPTAKPLQPKFSKLNPINGFKRLFSKQSLIELLKSILKIGLIVYISYSTIVDIINNLSILYDFGTRKAIAWMGEAVINLGIKISAFYLVLAFLDYAYEKRKFNQDMMMTKQEVKDEYKNAEGDPQIKGKIRRKMLEVSQRRMMQDVPQADVIITNPTHLSVAIKYDADVNDAPVVIAKGEDYLALKIREVAKENNIQIVENKPLARMLYHNVDVGSAIPPELYQAVAEILAMVYHAQGKI